MRRTLCYKLCTNYNESVNAMHTHLRAATFSSVSLPCLLDVRDMSCSLAGTCA